ncbi:sensor domain-containing protein [Streptomyces sp. NPDC047017]|uniref:sensor histidine kinase n=1 Tax=Streptomyces sp. NPDC047017 TaxID=3155024 RepID=UPI0033ED5A7C
MRVESAGAGRGGPGAEVWGALRGRPLRFLVSWWPWRCWGYLLTGTLFGYVALAALAVLLFLGVGLSVVGVGLLLLAAAVVLGVPVGAAERRRLRWVDPAPLPDPHASLAGTGVAGRLRTRVRERATWREFGYTVLLATVVPAVGTGFTALLGLSFLLTAAPVIVWAVAPDTVMLVPGHRVADPVAALPGTSVGLVGLAVCAYAGGLLAGTQVRVARFLLSARDEDLRSRVIELTRSRARLADAFEAERRRIERDLHDGAQQQLVALTMTLGLARLELRGTDSPAAELLARAQGEARRALGQLRDLVRGIHPQVLTDHGLTAAVAEVALRNPVPVTVDIDLTHRLPAAVESMAYFSVTEALTNAAKHSDASAVSVVGRIDADRFVLLITDDGRGGADPAAGAGLRGLADRLALHRGRLIVSSPLGGPTELRVEVPCCA